MFNPQTKILQNGLEVITIPLPALKSASALLVVNTGSRFENKSQFGAAHLLEHLVFKGTRAFPTSLELSIALDSVGAISNAFTSKESTGYYVTAASKHLPHSLKILKELIFYPLLREEDVEAEKLVVAEEIRMHHDAPDDFIADEFEQMVYQGSGLGHPISGDLKSVASLSAEKLKSFLNDWYGLENMVLVIAGDAEALSRADFFKEVEAIFDSQPEGRISHYGGGAGHHQQKRATFLSDNPISGRKLLRHERATEQAHLVLGWPALKRDDPQRYALMVLSTVLGGNRSSRLFDVVREQAGLAYYVYSDVDQYHDGGVFGASAGVNSERVEEAIEVIVAEFNKIADGTQPVTVEELKRAKDYLIGKIFLSLEHSYSVAQQYGLSKTLLGRIEDPDDIIAGIKKVSLKHLQKLAKQIIKKDEARVAVVK
jgi:predicted Zn-dependent peptidase